MAIENLSYLMFGVRDIDSWIAFAQDVVGLQLARRNADGSIGLRLDEYQQRILLVPDDLDDVLEVGWQFATDSQLQSFVQRLHAQGVDVIEGDGEARALRRVDKLYLCTDPNGVRHGLFIGPELAMANDVFRQSAGTGAGFETGRLGLGHLMVVARDYERSVAFYKDLFGLLVSDYIRQEIGPEAYIDATFFHTKTGRHHSLATAASPRKKRTSHFMLQYRSMDDVGLAFDRCVKANVPIIMGLGHHPNDKMFSFYAQTPSGFAIELGCGGVVIDDANWTVSSYSRLSDWGHEMFPRGGNPAAQP